MAVMDEQGQIQIHTENIFPIIKKAVYSGHEVFPARTRQQRSRRHQQAAHGRHGRRLQRRR